MLWKFNLVIFFGLVYSVFSLLRFCSNVCVVFLLMFGMSGMLLEELFISVRKLMISFGGMLYLFIIFFGLRMVFVMVLISVIFGVISCVIFLLLVLISIGCLVFLVLCVRVLIMLFVFMLEIVSSGSFIVLIIVCKGLICVCRLFGIGG